MKFSRHNQNTAISMMYRRIKDLQKLNHKTRTARPSEKMLDSELYEDRSHDALQKAWVAYMISCKKDDLERKKYYAAVIQKLEHELGKTMTDFPELKLMALDYYEKNLKDMQKDNEDMTAEHVMELMKNSDSKFWKQVRGEDL